MNKKAIVILAIVILAGVGFYVYTNQYSPDSLSGETTGQLPKDFPKDIPVEESAKFTQAFSRKEGDGTYSLVEFDSQKSLDDNFKIYKNFLTNTGWQITETSDEPNIKILRAVKGNDSIYINMYFNVDTQTNNVAIHFSDSPEPAQ